MQNLEATCVYVFTTEAALRTVVATLDLRRLLLLDVYYWVDLLSIVPFYAEKVVTSQPDSCTGGGALNRTLLNSSDAIVNASVSVRRCSPAELPQAMRVLQLLRLMRILKLMRHYVDMRVLILALSTAWRALLVPMFAMLLCILILSGAPCASRTPPHARSLSPSAPPSPSASASPSPSLVQAPYGSSRARLPTTPTHTRTASIHSGASFGSWRPSALMARWVLVALWESSSLLQPSSLGSS
jgi:hypothetical protein